MLNPTIQLIVLFLCIRIISSLFKSLNTSLIQFIGWILCSFSCWIAIAISSSAAPLLPLLLIAFPGFLIYKYYTRNIVLFVTDVALMITCIQLAIPQLSLLSSIIVLFTYTFIGQLIDLFFIHIASRRYKNYALIAILFVMMSVIYIERQPMLHYANYITKNINRIQKWAIFQPSLGHKIVLPTNDIAWIAYPTTKKYSRAAILFHGAHFEGSRQPAASILRYALLQAGYVVLSMDHPGFGASPNPPSHANVLEWDPSPSEHEAIRFIENYSSNIYLIGHSMGTISVLRNLMYSDNIKGAILIGSSLSSNSSNYLYERFHQDRTLSYTMNYEKFLRIHKQYYLRKKYAQTLDRDHPPITYVQVEHEFFNIKATRDLLYDMIPGKKNKKLIDDSNHYFNSWNFYDLIFGDYAIAKNLSEEIFKIDGDTLYK